MSVRNRYSIPGIASLVSVFPRSSDDADDLRCCRHHIDSIMASTTAAGPAITARFRELCFEFYTSPAAASKDGGNGKGGRALLEVFEGLAPSAGPAANSTASLPEVPLEAKWGNQIKQSGLDVAFFEALRRDPGLWYEFATVKNEARAAAHASMSASRVLTLKERIQNQRQQQAPAAAAAPAYEAILTAFRAYVVKYGSDPGLAALHHGLLAWMQVRVEL
jgi:hypothetical protein